MAAVGAGLLGLAACGGGGGKSASAGGSPSGDTHNAATTVTIRSASGHSDVLATPTGMTLYVSAQEHNRVLCKSNACTAIWAPLTVPSGQKPAAPGTLKGTLTTITRPDGKVQVALDGRPLYTFSFDQAPGQINGDGQKDSFDGTHFSWSLATAAGAGTGATKPPAKSSSAGNGYHY
ncbi:MAG: COG4315 family predicted lipoprotein [Mycobacteriales bacterium]